MRGWKIYEILQSLKFECGEELNGLFPFQGIGMHMLKYYQIVLMKPCFDAGLKSLAEAAGYPVAAIRSCSQFKRTQHFVLVVWEATYRAALLVLFLERRIATQHVNSCHLQNKLLTLHSLPEKNFAKSFNEWLTKLNTMMSNKFEEFIEWLANKDKT